MLEMLSLLLWDIDDALSGWTKSDDNSKIFYQDVVNSGWVCHSSANFVFCSDPTDQINGGYGVHRRSALPAQVG